MSSPPPGTPMLLDEDPDVEAQLLAYGLVPPGRTRPRPSAVSFAEDDETSASTSTGRPPLARSRRAGGASVPPSASWELGRALTRLEWPANVRKTDRKVKKFSRPARAQCRRRRPRLDALAPW